MRIDVDKTERSIREGKPVKTAKKQANEKTDQQENTKQERSEKEVWPRHV